MITIVSVVGARPNFMKIAPFVRAVEAYNREGRQKVRHLLIHTGQHYDVEMSQSFFQELGIPEPDVNLEIGSGSHAEQVGQTMIAFEKVLKQVNPDWAVVVGDVNATLACSVTAKKERVKLCHIEAGLRSRDMAMPEEINRLVTDRLADLLLTPDTLSGENLLREGVPEKRIVFVGNIMIDTLEANREKAAALGVEDICRKNRFGNTQTASPDSMNDGYALMTMHRPANVDDRAVLSPLVDFLCGEVSEKMPLIWPIHPRTEKRLKGFGLWNRILGAKKLIILKPIGYLEMLRLNMEARVLLTDSGGLQEECTVLGTPCLTLRWNTERPITLREHGGASVLVGNSIERIRGEFHAALAMQRHPIRPELWDGKTAPRCLQAILDASA